MGELTRCWNVLDVGKIFCVDLTNEDDSWGFNGGGDGGFEDFNTVKADELVLFNDPLIDCLNVELTDDVWEDGERLRELLLFVDEVNADNSERIELADGLELLVGTSGLSFFSLNPVANVAHPLVFLVVGPLVTDEVEFEMDGVLPVGLSIVFESDDWNETERESEMNWSMKVFTLVLNENSPETGTSVIEQAMPFLPEDSVAFNLLSAVGGLLLVLISLIEGWDCC